MDKKALDRITTPPKYAPNAILTYKGWVDPRTGVKYQGFKPTDEVMKHYDKRYNKGTKKKKHEESTVDATEETASTTTETLTPNETDGRQVLEETMYDDESDDQKGPVL